MEDIKFTKLQKQIIKEWAKVVLKHSSFGEIARKVGCSKQTVFRTVHRYEQLTSKKHGTKII